MNSSKILLIAGHVLFWLFNYWFIAFAGDINWTDFTNASGSLSYAYTYGLFFNAVLFYIQVFWLVPKIYTHNKKVKFYVLSFSIIIAISLIETYLDFILYGIYKINTRESFSGLFTTNVIFHILYSLAGFYYIFKLKHKKSEKKRQALVQENYKTELKYLKAQLNPHFLFNGINSIYHLIGKNDVLAKETVLQFSGLLRYQLYESNSPILIEKELDFVLKYIKIEATRKGSDIVLNYDITSENPTLKIAPLLLIPFIENAFKHCSNHLDSTMNTIHINIDEVGGELSLNVVNSYDDIRYKNAVGGIGLTNVQKRLSLLYPEKHKLDIKKAETTHSVTLSIQL